MPTYDFRCTSCRRTFEVTRGLTDDTTPVCPECGAAAKRVFTPVGIHFKGAGFHNTDYKKKSSEAQPAGEPACPAAGGGSCEGCPSAGAE
jgi:putative FmdB family regulatory protein